LCHGRFESDCPPCHRSYPAGSKRKENAIVKCGVLWRPFDFEEARWDPLLGPSGYEWVHQG
jgi:hypothetical protein